MVSLKGLLEVSKTRVDLPILRQQFASRVLDLSAKNLTGIDSGLISNLNFEPIEVNVNRNRLVEFPHCLQVFGSTLSTIRLAKNLIAEFPSITLPNLKVFVNLTPVVGSFWKFPCRNSKHISVSSTEGAEFIKQSHYWSVSTIPLESAFHTDCFRKQYFRNQREQPGGYSSPGSCQQ